VENRDMKKNTAEIGGEKVSSIFSKEDIFCANLYNSKNPQGYSKRFMWINRRIPIDIKI
jgi:hypothetical protein